MTLRRLAMICLLVSIASVIGLSAYGLFKWRSIQSDFAVFDRINDIEKTFINFNGAVQYLVDRPDSEFARNAVRTTADTLTDHLQALEAPAARPAQTHLREITQVIDESFARQDMRAAAADRAALKKDLALAAGQLELHQIGFASVLKAVVHERYHASREKVQSVILTYGVVSLALVLLPMGAFVVVQKRVVAPTQTIIGGLDRIKNQRLDENIDIRGGDELAAIARSINAMSAAIRERESRLQDWSWRFEVAADAAGIGVWDLDLVHGGLIWDQRMFEIYAVDPDEFSGTLDVWRSRVHPDDLSGIQQSFQRSVRETGTFNAEFRIVRPDRSLRYVRSYGRVTYDDKGDALRATGADVDITRQRETEAQLHHAQKMETIGHLTGGMAHDFNNMLTVVRGNLQLMIRRQEEFQDDKIPRWLGSSLDAVNKGAELTQRLLAFSRHQQLETTAVDVNHLLGGMEDMLQRTLGEDVELQVQRGESLPPVKTDVSQFENAVLNLTVNARDAMPGGGRLTIETSRVELSEHYANTHFEVTSGEYVLISVSDNGAGMSPEVQEHAFEPFYTTKERGKGTGLGLSTIFGFTKQSGGHVAIYSEEGIGTTIKLYFPVAIEDGSREAVPGTGEDREPPAYGHETILVVDDDDATRETAVQALESYGYTVLVAENGAHALRVLDDHSEVALLFTDIVMPGGMNGVELAEAACESNPGLRVLFTSGYAEAALQRSDYSNGNGQWIAKPFHIDELASRVRRVLSRPPERLSRSTPGNRS